MDPIKAFIDQVFEGQYAKVFDNGRSPKASTEEVTLMREEKGQLIAVLQAKCVLDNAHITALVVDEEHRGKDLGAALLQEFEALARERGLTTITLSTKSYQAEGFYLKMGYEVYARLEDVPEKGVTKFHFIKRLA